MKEKVSVFFLLFFVNAVISQTQQWIVYIPSNSGLPHHWIHAIAIEPNGTKWFGTENGIARLSGNNWTIYDSNNTPLLYPPIVKAIAVDLSGTKWFGLSSNGIVKFDGTHWTTINSGLPGLWINCLTTDPTGRVWVGTNNGLAIIDNGTITSYTSNNSQLPNVAVKSIEFDASGTAWIGTDGGGLVKFDGNNWTIYNTLNSGLPNNYIRCIAIETNGTKWIGTFNGGLVKFDGTNWTTYNSSNSALPYNTINCITIDANGNKWIGTYGSGLVKYNGTSWTVFDISNSGLYDNDIRSIKIDAYGNKWIGTMAGLAVYNEQGVGFENALFNIQNFVELYPNPAKDYVIIRFSAPELANNQCEIVVYDITGKAQIKQQVHVAHTENDIFTAKLHCSNLSQGMYFCELRANNVSIAKQKFVKE